MNFLEQTNPKHQTHFVLFSYKCCFFSSIFSIVLLCCWYYLSVTLSSYVHLVQLPCSLAFSKMNWNHKQTHARFIANEFVPTLPQSMAMKWVNIIVLYKQYIRGMSFFSFELLSRTYTKGYKTLRRFRRKFGQKYKMASIPLLSLQKIPR